MRTGAEGEISCEPKDRPPFLQGDTGEVRVATANWRKYSAVCRALDLNEGKYTDLIVGAMETGVEEPCYTSAVEVASFKARMVWQPGILALATDVIAAIDGQIVHSPGRYAKGYTERAFAEIEEGVITGFSKPFTISTEVSLVGMLGVSMAVANRITCAYAGIPKDLLREAVALDKKGALNRPTIVPLIDRFGGEYLKAYNVRPVDWWDIDDPEGSFAFDGMNGMVPFCGDEKVLRWLRAEIVGGVPVSRMKEFVQMDVTHLHSCSNSGRLILIN